MAGEDVKIMAYRNGKGIDLTVAIAIVDRFIKNEEHYFATKLEIEEEIRIFSNINSPHPIENIYLNALDVKGRGIDGLYLTVTGTSGEAGDSGQVGRGNDAGGIIPLCRPMASEAAPGKNPVSHVGKIYNALCFEIARKVAIRTNSEEVYCWLLSRIGKPINEPAAVSVQTIPKRDSYGATHQSEVIDVINDIISYEFEHLDVFCDRLAKGEIKLY
jgi:S-adenosylmethionine synthetase